MLFSAHSQLLSRLARASRLLATPLVATIGERAFGPLLSARLAALLDPVRAVEMAGRMPVRFLGRRRGPARSAQGQRGHRGDAAASDRADHARVAGRGEYVTMGSFVGHLGPDAFRAAVDQMDDAALLQVAFVLESKDSLQGLIALLPPERIDGIIDAASREDLWPEVLDLLSHLDTEQTRRFAELLSIQAEGVLERIVSVAREGQLWPHLLPLIPFLPEPGRGRVDEILGGLDLSAEERERLGAAPS